ncbi:MAG: acyl-CoA thioesterase [Chitinophagales bacterium]|nr:acyl-CoA thioesterase [Chitinophagales bacterium]
MSNATLPKLLESTAKIRFPDCDPFNHLNNSRYLDYIINAREDQILEAYQFDSHTIARETGLAWVIAQHQIAYLAPAMLMEEVVIQTRMLSYTDRVIQIEALMWNQDKTVLKTLMWTRLAHFNLRTMRSHTHSEEFLSLFSAVVDPLPAEIGFEERIKQLRIKV